MIVAATGARYDRSGYSLVASPAGRLDLWHRTGSRWPANAEVRARGPCCRPSRACGSDLSGGGVQPLGHPGGRRRLVGRDEVALLVEDDVEPVADRLRRVLLQRR